jgi:serine protease Do
MRSRTRRLVLALAGATAACGLAPRARAEDLVAERRSAVVRAVEKASPAIVSIRTNQIVQVPAFGFGRWAYDEEERENVSLGSGAIFHPDGYVITNAHVIARASRIIVTLYQQPGDREVDREARALAVDVDNDLAILKLLDPPPPPARSYPSLPLGRSNDLMTGETVIAIGNPFRLGITVTTGVVSALRRTVRPREAREREYRDFIQIDAAINPGNSGGPLLDVSGRWVGVNTAILNRAVGAEGIGFAIPSDRLRDTVARLFRRRLATGEWLGFEVGSDEDGALVVTDVFPIGPAKESGIRRGDRIVSVNDVPTDTVFDYRFAEMGLPRGSAMRLKLRRGGEVVSATLTLAPVPTAQLARDRVGIVARDADPTLMTGVVVTEVLRGGAGEAVGLRPGDGILRMGRTRIRNMDDLLLFLEYVRPGDSIDLMVNRGGVAIPGVMLAR